MMIENVHRLSLVGDDVFEFSMNKNVTLTFKDENVENDFIENFDEIIDETILTC